MIRRLDLAGAARISYRFPYILEIAELLVRKKMSTLSGTAQTHLFHLIDALLQQGNDILRNSLMILTEFCDLMDD